MRQTLLIAAAVLLGLFVIGGEWYLLARPMLAENPISSPVHAPQVQSGSVATAKPAATITPAVGTPRATPSLITVNTPTTVTVTVQISPTPIANSVNLLRLGATGTQPTILGVMHDDGSNGDVVANDGIYTLQIPFNETLVGQIQLQASIAFAGSLKRVLSTPAILAVWSSVTDTSSGLTFALPPLSTPPQVDNLGPTSGALFVIDIGAVDPTDNLSHSLFRLFALPNSSQENLQTWFESNVDDASGTLLTSGAFQQQQLPNGPALVLVNPIPAGYQGGPVAQAYLQLAGSPDRIDAISQSQDGSLTDYGYSASSVPTIVTSILGSLR
jgi:hypothetical protein